MKISVDKFNKYTVLKISGNFEMLDIKTFTNEIESAKTKNINIVLDLKQVLYIDSSAIGILLHYSKMKELNVVLVNISNSVLEVLKLTNITAFMNIKNRYEEID